MKLDQLFCEQQTTVNQRYLYHITEKQNYQQIQQSGVIRPQQTTKALTQERGVYFFASPDEESVSEIEGVVRFGGRDMDDDDVIQDRQDVPLVLLRLDVQALKDWDDKYQIDRQWFTDQAISDETAGVLTPQPIPAKLLDPIRDL